MRRNTSRRVIGFIAAGGVALGLFGGLATPAEATVYGGPTGWASTWVGCDSARDTIRVNVLAHGTKSYSTNSQYAVAMKMSIYSYQTGKWQSGGWVNLVPQGAPANTAANLDETFRSAPGRYLVYFDVAFQLSDGSWDYKAEYANSDKRRTNAQYGNYVQYPSNTKQLSCLV